MAQSPTGTDDRARSKRRAWIIGGSVILLVALIVGGLVALVVWAKGRDKPVTTRTAASFASYQGAWESAMTKAGVEATYPEGPVDLEQVRPTGGQPFSATFTAEEMAALLAVYRYSSDAFGGDVELRNIEVGFPSQGRASLSGTLTLNGNSYTAVIEAPAYFARDRVVLGRRDARLTVEGFSVGGARREQALRTFADYLNAMLKAAPGLTVEKAQIVEGGVRVEGLAPTKIEHPAPL